MTKIEVGIRTIKMLWLRCLIRHPNKLSQKWIVSIRNDTTGEVRSVRMLNTDNYANLLCSFLGGVPNQATPASGYSTFSVVDTSGNTDTLYQYMIGNSNCWLTPTTSLFVQLGTGTTAATRADHALQTPIAGTSNIAFSYTAGAASMTASATITYTASESPSEVGLFIYVQDTANAAVAVMIDHAVFTPLTAGLTFTITYTIDLS